MGNSCNNYSYKSINMVLPAGDIIKVTEMDIAKK